MKWPQWVAILFIVAGVCMLALGIYSAIVPEIPKEFVGEATAQITDIQVSYGRADNDGNRSTNHDVWVAYEIDGKKYERELGYYHTGMAIGGSVDIQYDTRDPSVITTQGGRLLSILIPCILGVAFLAAGILVLTKLGPMLGKMRVTTTVRTR